MCAVPGGARVLILSFQCTCTEVMPHLKPPCSYRKGWQYQHICCTLSQTVHGTQNTICMCTDIERNMEQKRYSMNNIRVGCTRLISTALKTINITNS